MLKLIIKTLFIVLSSKALSDGDISKYSSNIGNILIKCITNDNSFENEKKLFDYKKLNESSNKYADNKNVSTDKFRKHIVSIRNTNTLYILAYLGVLAKVDEIYNIFEKHTFAKSPLGTVLDKYYSNLKDVEEGISIYDAYIYLLTSALLSVIFDEAICKDLCFTKATRLVLSEPIQDIIQKVNEKLNTYINLC